jgi:HlyD family secretion protein
VKRFVVAFVLLTVLLGGLLGWRLKLQADEESQPPGSSGVVESRRVRVTSRLASRIIALHADEGDRVDAGALLAELDCAEPEALVAEAEARLEAAHAAVSAAEAAAVAAELSGRAARRKARSQLQQVESFRVQGERAERHKNRLGQLARDKVITESALDEGETTAADLTHRIRAADSAAQAAALSARAASRQAKGAESQVSAAKGQVAAVEAALRRALAMQQECRLVAPSAGVVTVRAREPGEVVLPGSTVFELRDASELEVTFYVSNADLGRVDVGSRVHALADPWPDLRFQGRVLRLGEEAEFTPRTVQTRSDRERLVFEVVARLEDPDGRLRAGMPVEVRVEAE